MAGVGSVTTVLNLVLLILAGLCGLGAIFFFIGALQARSSVPDRAYGVQQHEARQDKLAGFFRAGLLLILALIFLGIFGLASILGTNPDESTPEPTANPTEAGTSVPTSEPTVSATVATPSARPTSPINTSTPIPTDTISPTETPNVPTAVVNSPNGLWLREAPGGSQQVELLPDGVSLVVLPAQEVVEEVEWQKVRTQVGNEGWVAVEFVIYQ